MSPLTPESILASKAELLPIAAVITKLRRQAPYIQQEQHRYRSPRGFQHWANHLAFAAMIEAGLQFMDELEDPIGLWASYHLPLGPSCGGPAPVPGTGAPRSVPPQLLDPPRWGAAALCGRKPSGVAAGPVPQST
jgi:hypothetical protein